MVLAERLERRSLLQRILIWVLENFSPFRISYDNGFAKTQDGMVSVDPNEFGNLHKEHSTSRSQKSMYI